MTNKDLLDKSASEVVDMFNATVNGIDCKSTDASHVREKMTEGAKRELGIEFKPTKTDFSEISVKVTERLYVLLAVSVKTTKEIKKLTALKGAYLKEPGKFKLKKVIYQVTYWSFEYADESQQLMKRTGNIHGCRVNHLDLSAREGKLQDIIAQDILIEELQKQSEKDFKDIREGIKQDLIQPFVKPFYIRTPYDMMFKQSSFKKHFPEKYHDKFKSLDSQNLFPTFREVIGEINKELVEETVGLMF